MSPWPVAALGEAMAPLLTGCAIEVVPEIDSTNSELMRRARSGRTGPVLLVGERQTAGRGRLGRSWASRPGASLTFSLGLPLAPADWSGLSLAVGVSVAESLHPAIRLKWPNDLWLGDRKLGGILIETATFGPAGGANAPAGVATGPATFDPAGTAAAAGRYAVVGIGLNIDAPPADGLSTPPAALRELDPAAAAGSVLLRIAEPLVRGVQAFERSGFAPFRARFEARDALRGRPVTLSDGTAGTARGVDAAGSLRVDTPAGPRVIGSAEVSVRPAPAAG